MRQEIISNVLNTDILKSVIEIIEPTTVSAENHQRNLRSFSYLKAKQKAIEQTFMESQDQ